MIGFQDHTLNTVLGVDTVFANELPDNKPADKRPAKSRILPKARPLSAGPKWSHLAPRFEGNRQSSLHILPMPAATQSQRKP
jgi:hypothetical protein